jgi:hypothetical protein
MDGKILDGTMMLTYLGIADGTELRQRLTPLSEVVLKKDSLTPAILKSVIEYVETEDFTLLKRINTLPIFDILREKLEGNKENIEMSSVSGYDVAE